MRNIAGTNQMLLKDAGYTILEVALDQEDIDKLLVEIGLVAFAKAVKNTDIFDAIQMKLDPIISYKLKRYIDQQSGAGKLAVERQKIVMDRIALLARAEEI
jgi:DNA-binding transcriptional regulator of glucitol operon